MGLVPCNFYSEHTEDELRILSQHLIAETVAQQPPFSKFSVRHQPCLFNVNNLLKLFVLILFKKYV